MKFFRSDDSVYQQIAANTNRKIMSLPLDTPKPQNEIFNHYFLKLQTNIAILEEQQSKQEMCITFKGVLLRVGLILLLVLLILLLNKFMLF